MRRYSLECSHTDSERTLEAVWVSEEIKKALDMGYTNLHITQAWHFFLDKHSTYDSSTRQGGLFAAYVDVFVKIKQEASGYPSHTKTDSERKAYVDAYLENEGIQLDPSKIEKKSWTSSHR